MRVIIRYVPLSFHDTIDLARVLGITPEAVRDLLNKMPSDSEEWTRTLPGGFFLTLRRGKAPQGAEVRE